MWNRILWQVPYHYPNQILFARRRQRSDRGVVQTVHAGRYTVKKILLLIGICSCLFAVLSGLRSASAADWTIMVYMNGNNTLESDVAINFKQISTIGSTDNVNVVVQAARLSTKHVLRGRVGKGSPLDATSFHDLGDVDMGAKATLEDFIKWSIQNFKSTKYMVIIWNHGQGWRNIQSATAPQSGDSAVTPTPYRAISYDDLHNSKLYNKDVQDVLEEVMKLHAREGGLEGKKFDVVAFDACLMAMVETTYALRNSVELQVASEEVVPGYGFPYDLWLSQIVSAHSVDPKDVARKLGESYRDFYGPKGAFPDATTTLSVVDVEKGVSLAVSVSALADSLINILPSKR